MFIFAGAAYCAPIDFTNQDVVNSSWSNVNSANQGIFHSGFTIYIPTEITGLSGNVILASDSNSSRVLYSSGVHRFLSYQSDNSSLTVTVGSITFRYGQYSGDTSGGGGGAVYSSSNNLTVSGNIVFDQNKSNTSGGAIYLASGTLTLDGNIIFKYNVSGTDYGYGGAIYSGDNIVATEGSYIDINNSTSTTGGGAFYAERGYIIIGGMAEINSNRVISENIEHNGGAFYAGDYILFSSSNSIINIVSNSSQLLGGALYSGSSVTFYGGAKIESNQTTTGSSTNTVRGGGAIYAVSNVIFTSPTAAIELTKNTGTGNGGAILSGGYVSFSGSAIITGNSTETNGPESDGGAIWAENGIFFRNALSTVTISYNSVKTSNAGALYSNSYIIFDGYVTAVGNKSEKGYGGFSVSSGIVVGDGGEFRYNTAASSGGAFVIQNSTASLISAISRDVVFIDNEAAGKRNDIHMTTSTLTFFADDGRSITLNGGITSGGNNNFVIKTGSGTLAFNGDFRLQTFNVYAGTVTLGATATFEAIDVIFSSDTVIDMRNNNNNDILRISSNIISSALIYYDFDSDSNSSDLITANFANMEGTTIKVGIGGISASTKTYMIVKTTENSLGNMGLDKTNSQGNDMRRVNAWLTYKTDSNITSSSSWNNANLNVFINQLNAIQGLTENQLNVALALDRDYGNAVDDLFYIIDVIDGFSSELEKKDALNDISGHIYANAVTISALNASKNNILSRLKKSYFIANDSAIKRNVWIQGYGSSNLYKGDVDSPGNFKASNGGFLVGFDTMRDERYIFGVSAGYVGTSASQNNDKISIDGYTVGGYGSYFFENDVEAKFMIVGGRQNYDSSREIRYLNRTTKASFVGYSLNLSAEAGYDYYYRNNVYFRPFAGLDYSFVATNEFSETGVNFSTSAADLTLYAGSYNRANAGFGLQINNGTQMRMKWYGEVRMDAILIGATGEFTGKFKNSEHELEIKGVSNNPLNYGIGVGGLYDISSAFSAYINFNYSMSSTQSGYYGNIGLNYKFSTEIIGFYDR